MYRNIPTAIAIIILLLGLTFQSCQNAPTSQKEVTDATKPDSLKSNNYDEPHRPQFHFSPPEKWMNDPNGMVYFADEYHLFYQYYPDSTVWGPMHWGHAVSKDMLHWEHLPIALYPDSLGYIFSGSAVVDWKNTSGFGQDGQPPLIAIYTYHDMDGEKSGRRDYQYQAIAYSIDKGRTWTKYAGNPVIPNTDKIKDFRDPKVIWDAARNQWLMAFAAYDYIQFWQSKDLKSWTHLSDWGKEFGGHGGVWECPDIFPLQDEDTGETKWVLLVSINPGGPNGGSATQYFVGDFDGQKFKLDNKFRADVVNENAVWLDYGRDNYAGVTWSDIPKADGRRIFLGWMSNWDYGQVVPTEKWRSAMTLPRTLTLKNSKDGYRILVKPVQETNKLRSSTHLLEEKKIADKIDLAKKYGFPASQSELVLEIDLKATTATKFGVELSNKKGEYYQVGFDIKNNQFFSDRTKSGNLDFSEKFGENIHFAPRLSDDTTLKMQLFVDAASIELFADDGATTMTEIFFPSEDFSSLSIFSEGGELILIKGEAYELTGIWK